MSTERETRTELLQVRMTRREKSRLQREAELRGMKMSELVLAQLGVLLQPSEQALVGVTSPVPAAPAEPEWTESDDEGEVSQTVRLDAWLAGRTGLSVPRCEAARLEGRVRVRGEVFKRESVADDALESVELDGVPL